ncbi:hypothetical protein DAI22_08g028966 [Oryza sativa Japonica Group]|nr:hypothetical protein DAI22_08g028966 [Oryza sativa Japonica Group]
MTPKVGMKFNSEQEAYDFYNAYASEIGFSIRRSSYHYMGNTKIIKNRTFCCSREEALGYGNSFNRPETRCKCQACMKISLIDGFYQVYHFVPEHSHILATKSQAHQLRSQRKVNEAQVASVEVAKSVGISTKAVVDLLAKQSCGYENLGFTRVDMKNKLYSKRSLQTKQGDTGGVLEYMEKKSSEYIKFFYSIQVDEDDLITNIFWADSKMIADYEDFGDVVCFDTTYRKLNDGRPFGLLVGVNNHKKTTVFGAALLYDESADSFVWLFNTFLNVMSGKKPKTILTDEDAAMAKAIKLVFKGTHHQILYDRNTFSADMSTTQRNESFNNELKGYISVKYDMLTFFEHFDRLLGDKRYEEVKCDFRATQSTPRPKAELRILRDVVEVYTPAVYKIFEEEVMQTLNCDIFYCGDVDEQKVYKIKSHGKHHEHVVKFSPLESSVKCSCKKFEFAGILCSHALKVLDINNIKSVPQMYILK